MAALRASYHRILNNIEHMLPAKLRPLYNHPAGKSNKNAISEADNKSLIRTLSRLVISFCVRSPGAWAIEFGQAGSLVYIHQLVVSFQAVC